MLTYLHTNLSPVALYNWLVDVSMYVYLSSPCVVDAGFGVGASLELRLAGLRGVRSCRPGPGASRQELVRKMPGASSESKEKYLNYLHENVMLRL